MTAGQKETVQLRLSILKEAMKREGRKKKGEEYENY